MQQDIKQMSREEIRAMISKGLRVEEGFSELKLRTERVQAGMRAVHGPAS